MKRITWAWIGLLPVVAIGGWFGALLGLWGMIPAFLLGALYGYTILGPALINHQLNQTTTSKPRR